MNARSLSAWLLGAWLVLLISGAAIAESGQRPDSEAATATFEPEYTMAP
ncbi:MAG: hypothetical protein WCJ69_14605 [Betaproteobacteria bacterium]|jgi:hypothetical protein